MSEAAASYKVLAMDRNRRAMARSMTTAVDGIPHVTLHARADVTALMAARGRIVGEFVDAGGPKLTLTVLVARLVTEALRAYPRVNGRTEEGEIRLYDGVNLGIAVALDDGLVVPVVHDAHKMDLLELAAAISDLTGRARAGSIKLPELLEGTFTLSNLGAYGVEFFTPIINPPQLAILGVGALGEELRLLDGVAVGTPILHLSMSFNHAVMGGAEAAKFLQVVVRYVESPDAVLRHHFTFE